MNLKELRLRSGLKQTELADKLGIAISAYQKYEREERNTPAPVLIELSKMYGVSLEYLLGLPEPSDALLTGDRKRVLDAYDHADTIAKEDAILFLERHKAEKIKERLISSIENI